MILSAILCSLNVLSPYAVTVHKILPCYCLLQLCLNTIVLWVNMSRWQRMRFWEIQSNVDLTTALIPSLMTSFRQWHLRLDRISMRSSQQSSRKIHGTNSSLRHLQLKCLFCHYWLSHFTLFWKPFDFDSLMCWICLVFRVLDDERWLLLYVQVLW